MRALPTTALAAFAGYASVVGFGLGPCGGSGGVPNDAPPARDAICKIISGHKPGTLFGPASHGGTVRPIVWMALPAMVVLAGVIVAGITQKRWWAYVAGAVAALLVVLPWAALAVSSVIHGS